MDYFSKFIRSSSQPSPKVEVDHAQDFHKSWMLVKNTLLHPDERQLSKGIKSTDTPVHLQSMVDALVWESARTEEGGTGPCLEYLLKNDVLGTLVKLSEADRPFGIQVEVLRSVQNMVVLLDEQFLVHSVVHKAVLRLLRNCVGDDIQEQLDGRTKVVGAAGTAVRSQPSEYEEDLVNFLCILCSRIRHYRELLMIFFHDKHWYRPEPLFAVEEEDEEEDEESQLETQAQTEKVVSTDRSTSPAPSEGTVKSAPKISEAKKSEYEFLLFNYLLRFVHREGRIGEFARAGLLFLMDVAMSPVDPSTSATDGSPEADSHNDAVLALAEYILDGDFSEVLAAGLAAVYSLLPTKLSVIPPVSTEPAPHSGMILGNNPSELSEDERDKLDFEKEKNRALGLEESSNDDFKSRLDHFLKILEFLQDVLRRNKTPDSVDPSAQVGSAIVQSILDAVRRVFLENVLYPSILECSDTDGSAVAVMSYVDIMIKTVDNGQLGELLIEFLMSEDNTDSDDLTRTRMRPATQLPARHPPVASRSAKLRRRKSTAMILLEMETQDTRRPSEYFTSMGRFTLKDLLLSSLKSRSLPTITAALELFQSILNQFCRLSVEKLLVVISDSHATAFPYPLPIYGPSEPIAPLVEAEEEETFVYPGTEDTSTAEEAKTVTNAPLLTFPQPNTSYRTHEREMELYLTLVSRVDPNHAEDAFSTGYDHYLRDALIHIQAHSCFHSDSDPETRVNARHRLNPHDPMLSGVLESLRQFFANTPELNMALTGVLATLAICPDRSLAGWLTFANKDSYAIITGQTLSSEPAELVGHEDGDDRSVDWRIEEKLASERHSLPALSVDEQSRPVVHTILHGLVSQLERYRQSVENFDQYLRERRQGLLFSENLTDALSLALDFDPTTFSSSSLFSRAAATPPPTEPTVSRPKAKSMGSSFVSFLNPRKSKPAKPQQSESASRSKTLDTGTPMPFGTHYERTGSVLVEPFSAPAPSSGPWTPSKPTRWNADEEDVLASSGQWDETSHGAEPEVDEEEPPVRQPNVTLSRLLDNVVILEESMKELAAIIHARRSLGIDPIRYL